ncbi:MAG: D-glycero-beta-D-manno-heptose 1-phosphate adenylyltransferase [Gammaproteobacteria bacterium]|nr:D-glycero-beta-D-manno-heptose 1-phosphate adenylyltransferase [Gammaproteobacteria bacterium]MDH3370790.1 D-glycero-beta-D-manno-heptose 1-phosphate adenylyltransferase [Gammaproteobacteria bacterium]MDH3562458.1 D-glycero-beta-D-manno-heptose 1-phosphate adenylyltransferase [Gammaproteobacteria bacterium]MDH5488159.1 D-glycero-beta-D-manno-heptose 1-phosphate adenylyltransferase [Gammaproteobacteria bacterium]
MTDSQRKIVRDAAQLAARLAQLARPIVFTNGCFDILHRGHVAYLEEAAALGKSLVVGVNSDASVRRLEKGQNRPVNPLDDRMAVLAALGCVSLVIPFDDDTPLALIKQVRPEHLVKGGDWPSEKIVGADVVKASGGQVHSIPFRFDRSTTEFLKRIRSYD